MNNLLLSGIDVLNSNSYDDLQDFIQVLVELGLKYLLQHIRNNVVCGYCIRDE